MCGYYILCLKIDLIFKNKIYCDDINKLVDVQYDTIGQYTGLKDKNEKEIYEGEENEDIFKRKFKHHEIKHKVLYFEVEDWGEQRPCDMGTYSVEDINKQAVTWIHTSEFNILAGTIYENFIDIIEKNGGKIYLPKEEFLNE